jgi:regulator of protease activity HflC (stomatin/prohibitin superfamily)
VVERLGRFHGILNAGFHVLLPFWMSSVPLVERPVVFRRRCASRATTCRSASMACST